MASRTSVISFHQENLVLAGTGSMATILGIISHFTSYDLTNKRNELTFQKLISNQPSNLPVTPRILFWMGAASTIIGFILIVLAISFNQHEKNLLPGDTAGVLLQQINIQSQPNISEPTILASVGAVLTIIGLIWLTINYQKKRKFGVVAGVVYTLGLMGLAISASMSNHSASLVHESKLAWTIPGVMAIVAGTYLIPWERHHKITSGPACALISIGLTSLTIGITLTNEL